MCDKLWKIWGLLNILVAILCFADMKVKVNKYTMLPQTNYVKTSG